MLTLKEFISKINCREHFRVYQTNRDCLIFESYFKVHSPYFFDKKHKPFDYNKKYYEENGYCDDVYNNKLDKETKEFLKEFGDCEVFSLECSGFRPSYMHKVNGELKIDYVEDAHMPNREYLNCFNIFIKC